MTSGPGCACERVRELRILISAATPVDTSSRSANLAKLQRVRSCETMPRLPLARCSLDPFPAPSETSVHSGIPNYPASCRLQTDLCPLIPFFRALSAGVFFKEYNLYFAGRVLTRAGFGKRASAIPMGALPPYRRLPRARVCPLNPPLCPLNLRCAH